MTVRTQIELADGSKLRTPSQTDGGTAPEWHMVVGPLAGDSAAVSVWDEDMVEDTLIAAAARPLVLGAIADGMVRVGGRTCELPRLTRARRHRRC